MKLASLAISLLFSLPGYSQTRPNVLFITVDDLRPQLGCYGDRVVKSPNIDRLARQSRVFRRAYCQQALCSPSRTSLLTGKYPTSTQIFDIETHFRQTIPQAVTLPQYFRQHGYVTVGLNKVFHLVGFEPRLFGNLNDTASWSQPHWLPTRSGWGPEGEAIYQKNKAELLKKGPVGYGNIPRSVAYEAPDVPDSTLMDAETALEAIRRLRQLKSRPFFLAVGFYKPHLPFVAPKKYWDLYDEATLTLPENRFLPRNAPAYVGASLTELRSYTNISKTDEIDDAQGRKLLHGYLASISYVDAQIGLVLDELERLGLRRNTIVVLLGDHGFQVGEHGFWGSKHTNFETSTRAPLLISAAPGSGMGRDLKAGNTDALVEFLDIFPTVLELAGLPPKKDNEGRSLLPLLRNPKQSFREMAQSWYPKGNRMGHSIRTDRYRFTAWKAEDGTVEYELYDHRTDPQENENVAGRPENGALIAELKQKMIR